MACHSFTIHEIELTRLIAHPQNPNRMSPATLGKLQRHIAQTGRYEPLLTRPHPTVAGAFELINGHHRKRALEALGHRMAACLVWELSDEDARLLLATVNRLSGKDVAARRLELLESLGDSAAKGRDVRELAALLPESQRTLAALLAAAPAAPPVVPPRVADLPEAFTVFLSSGQKRRLLAALRRTHNDPALALLLWLRENESIETINGH